MYPYCTMVSSAKHIHPWTLFVAWVSGKGWKSPRICATSKHPFLVSECLNSFSQPVQTSWDTLTTHWCRLLFNLSKPVGLFKEMFEQWCRWGNGPSHYIWIFSIEATLPYWHHSSPKGNKWCFQCLGPFVTNVRCESIEIFHCLFDCQEGNMIWVIKGLLVAEWFAIAIVLVLSKYYKSVKVLCSFEQETTIVHKLPNICFISCIKKQGPDPFACQNWSLTRKQSGKVASTVGQKLKWSMVALKMCSVTGHIHWGFLQ